MPEVVTTDVAEERRVPVPKVRHQVTEPHARLPYVLIDVAAGFDAHGLMAKLPPSCLCPPLELRTCSALARNLSPIELTVSAEGNGLHVPGAETIGGVLGQLVGEDKRRVETA